MSLHWYACISTNTYCFEMYHIQLETDWWALSNTSSIVRICLAVYEILADKAFTATDGLISQSFVVAFIHPTYMQIALIWGFLAQLYLWKSVHWLWRYKLNEVYDISYNLSLEYIGSMILKLLSRSSKKFLPFLSEACNVIFQVLLISLHLLFQLKSYKDLYRKIGRSLNFFVSLLTISYRNYLS